MSIFLTNWSCIGRNDGLSNIFGYVYNHPHHINGDYIMIVAHKGWYNEELGHVRDKEHWYNLTHPNQTPDPAFIPKSLHTIYGPPINLKR